MADIWILIHACLLFTPTVAMLLLGAYLLTSWANVESDASVSGALLDEFRHAGENREGFERRLNYESDAWLPRWAHAEITIYIGNDPNKVLGAAIPGACVAVCITWGWFVALGWLAYPFSTCDSSGAAAYEAWLPLASIPLVLILLRLEFQCAKYSIFAQVCINGPFTTLGQKAPFLAWFAWCLFLSLVGHADTITNTLFMVGSIASHDCIEMRPLAARFNKELIFHEVMRESSFGAIPGLEYVSIMALTIFAWGLMLLQPLYAVLASMPVPREWRRLRNEGMLFKVNEHCCLDGATYESYLFKRVDYKTSLAILADAGRMASLTSEHTEMLTRSSDSPPNDSRAPELGRAENWFLISSLLEILVFLNLQGTDFALTAAATMGSVIDLHVVISMLLGIASSSWCIYKENKKVRALKNILAATENEMKSKVCDMEYVRKQMVEATENHSKARRTWYRFIMYDCMFVFGAGYALSKVIMVFWCEDHVWNLTGCVDLSGMNT